MVAVVLAGVGAVAYALTTGSSSTNAAVNFGHTSLPVPSGFPTPSDGGAGTGAGTLPGGPGLPSTAPSLALQLCQTASSGFDAATIYVGAALTGIGNFAQTCVYKNSVPVSVTNSLRGKLYAPTTGDQTATDIQFSSIDGTSRITVHTKKEADGNWYVVGVTTG